MQYAIPILLSIAKFVEYSPDGVGRVTPRQVHSHLNYNGIEVSDYKVRQMFKECLEDGLLTFHSNHYRLNTEHALCHVFQDAKQVLYNG